MGLTIRLTGTGGAKTGSDTAVINIAPVKIGRAHV